MYFSKRSLATSLLITASLLTAPALQAQTAPAAAEPAASAPAPKPWTYKTPRLNRQQIDRLLGNPKKLLIIDVRRPDELVKYGSFAVYLNLQLKDLPYALDYIPKDRVLLIVSNRAYRGGEAGDFLTSQGFKVAGAAGSEEYKEAGGHIIKIAAPTPKPEAK